MKKEIIDLLINQAVVMAQKKMNLSDYKNFLQKMKYEIEKIGRLDDDVNFIQLKHWIENQLGEQIKFVLDPARILILSDHLLNNY